MFIGTSIDPRLSVFLFVVSVYGYIIGNLHVYEQSRSSYSASNCAVDVFLFVVCFFFLLFLRVYVRLLIRISFSLFVSLSLIVGVSVRFLIRVSHSLFVSMFISVFGYTVTDSMCIGRTSLDQRLSLFLSIRVYYRQFART